MPTAYLPFVREPRRKPPRQSKTRDWRNNDRPGRARSTQAPQAPTRARFVGALTHTQEVHA